MAKRLSQVPAIQCVRIQHEIEIEMNKFRIEPKIAETVYSFLLHPTNMGSRLMLLFIFFGR